MVVTSNPTAPDPASPSAVNEPNGRRVIRLPIDPGFTCLRGLSPKRLRFEVEYGLEHLRAALLYFEDADKPVRANIVRGAIFELKRTLTR